MQIFLLSASPSKIKSDKLVRTEVELVINSPAFKKQSSVRGISSR